MSEPFLERLSRFTPEADGLDRDTLLFAAGRASARPNRGWISLAGVLAGTQVLSLVLLWPHPGSPAADVPPPGTNCPAPRAPVEAPASETEESPGLWSVHHNPLDSQTEDRPAGTGTFVESGPPLRAFASPPSSILN
jgi:hypothetical protein